MREARCRGGAFTYPSTASLTSLASLSRSAPPVSRCWTTTPASRIRWQCRRRRSSLEAHHFTLALLFPLFTGLVIFALLLQTILRALSDDGVHKRKVPRARAAGSSCCSSWTRRCWNQRRDEREYHDATRRPEAVRKVSAVGRPSASAACSLMLAARRPPPHSGTLPCARTRRYAGSVSATSTGADLARAQAQSRRLPPPLVQSYTMTRV